MSTETCSESSGASGESDWTTRRLLDWIRGFLEANEVDSPRVCAELLLGHVLDCERLRLYMEPDRVLSEDALSTLRALVERASRHEPVQYLVGAWPFHGREFEVSPCTLIPRPCTEGLVELALEEVKSSGLHQGWRILDMCTGSGCIAVSLAASVRALRAGPVSERTPREAVPQEQMSSQDGSDEIVFDLEREPVVTESKSSPERVAEAGGEDECTQSTVAIPDGRLLVTATDVVREALELAGRNARRHGLDQELELRLGSLFTALPESDHGVFDIICANPPYVSDSEYSEMDRNVKDYEPRTALHGGPNGLDFIEPILRETVRWIKPGGLLLIEIGANSASDVTALVQALPEIKEFRIALDHEEFPRFLVARF
jgi:release factor glutamine methyltransferase